MIEFQAIREQPFRVFLLMLPLLIAAGVALALLELRVLAAILVALGCVTMAINWTWLITSSVERRWLIGLVALSITLHLGITFGLERFWPSFDKISDSALYTPHTAKLAQSWQKFGWVRYEEVVKYPISGSGYVYFSAIINFIFGINTLYVKIFNGMFAAIAIVYCYKIGVRLVDHQSARFAAYALAFMPSLLLWTSQNLKDAVVLLLSVWIFWEALMVADRRIWRIPVLGVLLLALGSVRAETAVGLAVMLSTTLLFQTQGRIGWRIAVATAALLVVGVLFQQAGYGFLGQEFIESRLSLEAITQRQQQTAFGGSAVAQIDPSTPVAFVAFLPIAVINYLLRPWPWEATKSALQLATIPESVLLWYPLFGLACVGFIWLLRHRLTETMALWAYTLAATVAAAPNYGNLGTAYRHRVQLWPFFFLLAGVGWTVLRTRRNPIAAPTQPGLEAEDDVDPLPTRNEDALV